MTVHRLIFRWDFGLNTKIFDHPGEIMEAIEATNERRWTEIRDSPAKRSFGVRFTSPDGKLHRSLTFEPINVVFNLEWLAGVPVQRLENDADFSDHCALLDRIKEVARISKLSRSGIRFFYLNKLGSKENLLRSFSNNGCKELTSVVERHAGAARDIGIQVDGTHEDGVLYHFRCGPFFEDEKGKYFSEIDDVINSDFDRNFISDADFYEMDFMPSVSAKSWATPLIVRFGELIRDTEKLVSKE
jgi:hypothetical protein